MIETLILSPHYDDAALSCGGLLARLADEGAVATVATLFAARPNYADLSPFAQEIHDRPPADEDLIGLRRAEEAEALAVLQARSVFGPWLDCIYRRDAAGRRWLVTDAAALFDAADAEDTPLVEAVVAWVEQLVPAHRGAEIIAPLAVGNHVDHQLTHRAALALRRRGRRVRFYVDYPYAVRHPAQVEPALARLPDGAQWQVEATRLSEAQMARKITAILAYRSQLAVLFPGEAPAETRVTAAIWTYARQCGGGSPAELLVAERPGAA